MPHIDLGPHYVRHPDFYVQPDQPQRKGVSSTANFICWTLVVVLLPFDVIALAAIFLAVKGH